MSVFPQPALPQTNVALPRGNPPPVVSSSPWMPLGALGKPRGTTLRLFVLFMNPLS
jgi:hypothetical protein